MHCGHNSEAGGTQADPVDTPPTFQHRGWTAGVRVGRECAVCSAGVSVVCSRALVSYEPSHVVPPLAKAMSMSKPAIDTQIKDGRATFVLINSYITELLIDFDSKLPAYVQ